jgi:hypothetical protein
LLYIPTIRPLGLSTDGQVGEDWRDPGRKKWTIDSIERPGDEGLAYSPYIVRTGWSIALLHWHNYIRLYVLVELTLVVKY